MSDWSSDVCSSDLVVLAYVESEEIKPIVDVRDLGLLWREREPPCRQEFFDHWTNLVLQHFFRCAGDDEVVRVPNDVDLLLVPVLLQVPPKRSEEHTSELQSLMRISYAVFCLKKKNNLKDNYHFYTQ